MIILYSLVILSATTVGAIAGLGGGVIIKPLLDMIGYHDATTIGFYSCVAVFTMCVVSIIKQLRKGFQLDIKTVVYISIGSSLGGLFGDKIFVNIAQYYSDQNVKLIQSILLLITLILILIYTLKKDKIKSFHIKNFLSIFTLGLFLGTVSVFLGIGGGPLNVSLLILLFSYGMKQATIYSIATIFFSQLSKLSSIIISGNIMSLDLSFVPFICASAILGGYIGTMMNQKLSDSRVEKIYVIVLFTLIGISLYNIFVNI